ncbi:hypothetical protein R1flu_013596 [Riccia fluitans]|uniref:Uncharacterized protein n=1 Tax=Riccia fluitans TaxID=41844 RepID=A0ABD1YE01_9MARC
MEYGNLAPYEHGVRSADFHKYLEAMKPVMATMMLVTNEAGRSSEAPDCTAGPGAGAGAAAMETPMLEKATAATMAKATADRMVKAMTEIVFWDEFESRRETKHKQELRAQLCFDNASNLCGPKQTWESDGRRRQRASIQECRPPRRTSRVNQRLLKDWKCKRSTLTRKRGLKRFEAVS